MKEYDSARGELSNSRCVGLSARFDRHGPAPFIPKLMQLLVSMDRMVGKDFET